MQQGRQEAVQQVTAMQGTTAAAGPYGLTIAVDNTPTGKPFTLEHVLSLPSRSVKHTARQAMLVLLNSVNLEGKNLS